MSRRGLFADTFGEFGYATQPPLHRPIVQHAGEHNTPRARSSRSPLSLDYISRHEARHVSRATVPRQPTVSPGRSSPRYFNPPCREERAACRGSPHPLGGPRCLPPARRRAELAPVRSPRCLPPPDIAAAGPQQPPALLLLIIIGVHHLGRVRVRARARGRVRVRVRARARVRVRVRVRVRDKVRVWVRKSLGSGSRLGSGLGSGLGAGLGSGLGSGLGPATSVGVGLDGRGG